MRKVNGFYVGEGCRPFRSKPKGPFLTHINGKTPIRKAARLVAGKGNWQ